MMRIRYGSVFSLLFFFVLSGCGAAITSSTDRAILSGRYAKVESVKADIEKNISSARSEEIIDLCYASWKQKKYRQLFKCLDRLEANIANGDDRIFANTFWVRNKRSGVNYPENITVLPHLIRAEVSIDFGDYVKAIEHAQKALSLIDTVKWLQWDNFNNWPKRLRIRTFGVLALARALAGDRQRAAETVQQLEDAKVGFVAMALIKKEKHQQLARVYMATGEYEKVLELKTPGLDFLGGLTETLILGTKLTGDDIFAFVDLPSRFMFNKALRETGRIREARTGYDELLAHPSTSQNGDIYWLLLFERGRIAETEKNPQAALNFYRKAIEVIEKQRSSINTEASKIGFVGDKQMVYLQTIKTLVDLGHHALAFEYAERAKSRALVDLLASSDQLGANRPEIAQMTSELSRLEVASKAQGIGDAAKAAKTRGIEVRNKIKLSDPTFYSLIAVSTPSAGDLQSLLANDETLVEYYAMGDQLFAFVVTRNRISAHRLDGRKLSAEVSAIRKAFTDPEIQKAVKISDAAYRRLIAPLAKQINTTNLVVVPHGVLHRLPFGALFTGSEFLLEKFSVSYLPSCSVLHFLRDGKAARSGAALVFGNPDLGDPRFDLKNAEAEAVRVGRAFPEARVMMRKAATETEFKYLSSRYGTVHFACHGIFSPNNPLTSGLLLRKDDKNDGLLTAGELYGIRLDADLVTLSACETGVGDIQGGDDVIGLTRGFLYAGTRSILASLWQVDDKATADLMVSFYGHLIEGDKREALRQAQLEIRRKNPHPYYWAAFELIGRAR